MPKIKYKSFNFRTDSLLLIKQANEIVEQYAAQGYDLTLRQLYYQFVSRDLLANKQANYKRLGGIVNDARLAGMIDWERIEDRTRGVEILSSWEGPEAIVRTCAKQFRLDLWESQPVRIEVWIEKEALAGVFERICNELRVPYLSCRGYTSQSEMWRAGRRLRQYIKDAQKPVILHFGDHDPSGIDMSRDIKERLEMFIGARDLDFRRLALNMEQVEQYSPPPNPAKATDARFKDYQDLYGDESWELDALDPSVLSDLVDNAVTELRDGDQWEADLLREEKARTQLQGVADKWDEVVEDL